MTNAEKIIIAATIDAVLEDALKENLSKESFPELNLLVAVCRPDLLSKEKEDLLNNLIGKKYIPRDNSYIREIVNGKRKDWGALIGVPCEIISKPYIITISDGILKPFQQRMIRVKSLKTGLIYEVMFAESWLVE